MNQKQYVGPRVSSFEEYGNIGPITGVVLLLDEDNEIVAGNDSGYMMEIECPYGTQTMANNILSIIQGNTYKGFRADNAELDMSAELGDGITVNGLYSMLAYRNLTFGPAHMSEIAAPGESELEHEYPYISSTQRTINRKIAQTRSLITKTAEEIRLEVQNELEGLSSSLTVSLNAITAQVSGLDGAYSSLKLTVDGLTVTDGSGTTRIKGSSIDTTTISANSIRADQVNLTGSISFSDMDIATMTILSETATKANSANSLTSGWVYSGTTEINGNKIMTGTVTASHLRGGTISLINAAATVSGSITLSAATSGAYAVDVQSMAAMRLFSNAGDMWLEADSISQTYLWLRSTLPEPRVECQGHFNPRSDGVYSLGSAGYAWRSVWALEGTIQTSDRNLKHEIVDIPEKYVDLFMGLKPRLYKYNDGTSDRYHVGYISQEVEEAMELSGISAQEFAGLVIDHDEAGTPLYMLRYDEFMALHTMMIQRMVNKLG